MSSIASLKLEATIESVDGPQQVYGPKVWRWAPATALPNGQRTSLSCTGSAFTALSPPTGAVAVIIIPPVTAVSLTLRGITGDTGIPIVPATAYKGLPLVIPFGAAPALGIYNAGATCLVEVIYL